jgi:hypothetical protein
MLAFEVLAQCDENAGFPRYYCRAEENARQFNGLQDDERMTSFGRTNSMGTRQPVPTH